VTGRRRAPGLDADQPERDLLAPSVVSSTRSKTKSAPPEPSRRPGTKCPWSSGPIQLINEDAPSTKERRPNE